MTEMMNDGDDERGGFNIRRGSLYSEMTTGKVQKEKKGKILER
jgi:hypothetical protein